MMQLPPCGRVLGTASVWSSPFVWNDDLLIDSAGYPSTIRVQGRRSRISSFHTDDSGERTRSLHWTLMQRESPIQVSSSTITREPKHDDSACSHLKGAARRSSVSELSQQQFKVPALTADASSFLLFSLEFRPCSVGLRQDFDASTRKDRTQFRRVVGTVTFGRWGKGRVPRDW